MKSQFRNKKYQNGNFQTIQRRHAKGMFCVSYDSENQ